MGEHAKLEEVPYFGVGERQTHRDEGREVLVYGGMDERTPRCLPNVTHIHWEDSSVGPPLPYVFELLSRQIPADTGQRDDEVLNCRKAIWGWAASGSPE